MKIQEVWAVLLGCLLLGALPACGTADDDDDTVSDDDDTASNDDDSAGDDDDSAGDDDDTADAPSDEDGDTYTDDVDCNDQDALIHPGADELCDVTDRNCDGDAELDAVDAPTWYEDVDGDGYGLEANSLSACDQPHGYSAYLGDCNDTDPSYHPGATEADCTDPNDYNCDQSVGYADVDGDGEAACEDCNDNDIAVNSAETETCNSVDDDCDGQVDEAGASGESTWYLDGDGDGYGRLNWLETACSQPTGFVANSDDCDDLQPGIYPGATEVCDEIDNNCNSQVDEGAAAPSTWYADADGDGVGNAAVNIVACSAPFGTVAVAGDCDDLDASSFPGGTEVCDGADNNCDTQIDEGVTTTFYGDSDGDGYGDLGTTGFACFLPGGFSSNSQDCNDGDAATHPGAVEVCDGVDNDCDGNPDNAAVDAQTWYSDIDTDGYGNPATASSVCTQPGGTVSNGLDCDDADILNFPGNTELCDGADNNCDTVTDDGLDNDGDGVTPCGLDGITGNSDDDCDDVDEAIHPGAVDVCDGEDNNCNDQVDEGSEALGTESICPAVSCQEIITARPQEDDGLYWIDYDGTGPSPSVQAYCDMTFEGGGWTRIFGIEISDNSGHSPNGQPVAEGLAAAATGTGHVRSDSLSDYRDAIGFTHLRFECEKPQTGRKIHLAATSGAALDFFTARTNTFPPAAGSFVVYPDDTSLVSPQPNNWGYNSSYYTNTWGHGGVSAPDRLWNHAMFVRVETHWLLSGTRYECDDYNVGTYNGYWYIWVR